MKKEYIIPIFVPHQGCPNQCTFCNQKKISGQLKKVTAKDVEETIEYYLKNFKDKNKYVEVAFFGGSFTAIDEKEQEELLYKRNEQIKLYKSKCSQIKNEIRSNKAKLISDNKSLIENYMSLSEESDNLYTLISLSATKESQCALCRDEKSEKYFCAICRKKYCVNKCAQKCKNSSCNTYLCTQC